MAHELDIKADGTAAMAYTGETPWHGLGTYLGDQDVDSRRMIAAAGLDWTVSRQKLITVDGVDVPNQVAIVRNDRNAVLGVTSSTYEPLQNAEVFSFLDDVLGEKARYHTAGSLRGGRIVWALVKLTGDMAIRRPDGSDDVVEKHLMVSTGHDGRNPMVITFTNIRVVCANTWTAATRDLSEKTNFRIYHFASMRERIEIAKRAMIAQERVFSESLELCQSLANEPIRSKEFDELVDRLILDVNASITEAKESLGKVARRNFDRDASELRELFESGRGNRGETKWDAFNAVTEWIDHRRGAARMALDAQQQVASRLGFSWFGDGAKMKERALRLLVK
jgi:phage/plasmid-like protein (TIGR03299 family)